jgi:hypothetical protein
MTPEELAMTALLKHIEDMDHDRLAYYASSVEQFYYLAELKRLAHLFKLSLRDRSAGS